jgi:hypothetical protein
MITTDNFMIYRNAKYRRDMNLLANLFKTSIFPRVAEQRA